MKFDILMTTAKDILVITTASAEGLTISRYIKPVATHVVAGTNLFNDLLGDITDIFGGRSQSYQKQLSSLYAEAIERIKIATHELGGNCVLGLKIDIDEISGKGKSMFMITAIGTAAVAENLSSKAKLATQDKLENVSVEKINALRSKNTIMKQAETGALKLTDSVWEFISAEQIDELIPFLLKEFAKHFTPDDYENESEHVDKYYNSLKNFINSLPEDKKIIWLYDSIANEKNDKIAIKLLQMIRELHLLDLNRTTQLLQSQNFIAQKRAVAISTFDKLFYNQQDISQFEIIRELLLNSFANKGEITTKKQLLSSKEKEVWNCECGKVNEIESYCPGCHKDIKGFKAKEIKPDTAANYIQQKIDLITTFVE